LAYVVHKARSVTRLSWTHRLLSLVLAIGFATSPLAVFAGTNADVCREARHNCAHTVLTEGCCQLPGPATPAPATIAVVSSIVMRLAQHMPAWLRPDLGLVAQPDLIAGLVPAPDRPDRSSATTSDLLTVLLI
jgi:hypothetical protein